MSGQNGGMKFGKWFQDTWHHYQEHKAQEKMLHQIIEQVVELADPYIRQAKRYHNVLRDPIVGSMEYCTSIVDALPGPVELSRKGYHANPLVKSLFASMDELEEVVRISPEVQAFKDKGAEGNVTALLTMTSEEKIIFGHQQKGELIMRDVAQRAISFHDHRVVSIATDVNKTKDRIMHRGLEALATVAMENITTLRQRRAVLREKRAYLKGVRKILGGKNHMMEMFAAPGPGQREEYRKAVKKLAEVNLELDKVKEQIATPEHSLGFLEDIMNRPGDLLMMRSQSFRLNWKGVRVDDTPESEGNDITLAEFSVGEELRRSAVLVTFSLGSNQ
jgi:hypothetical protein